MVGFFLSLLYVFKASIADNSFDPRDLLLTMIGALVAKFSTIVDWFFGTSESSEAKTVMMTEMYKTQRINDDTN